MRAGVVPAAGQAVLPGQGLLVRQQQRLVAGVEAGLAELRRGFGTDPARFHEGERFADAVGKRLILRGPGRPAHEVQHPGMNLVQVGITALGKGAQQVQRCGRLVIGLHHALRIGLAAFRGEADVVDIVAAIRGQADPALFLHRGRARLGELPGHAADLHHRQLGRIGKDHRHLQHDTKRVAYVVGVKFGEALGAVAALQQKGATGGGLRQFGRERPGLSREHQRGVAPQFRLRIGENRRIGVIGHLPRFMFAPAARRPGLAHGAFPNQTTVGSAYPRFCHDRTSGNRSIRSSIVLAASPVPNGKAGRAMAA